MRIPVRPSGLAVLAIFFVLASLSTALAQEEFPPPQGKGRLVVVSSGKSGPEHYKTVARAIAQMGYDVVLFDSNPMEGTHGEGLKTALAQAQQMPKCAARQSRAGRLLFGRRNHPGFRRTLARSGGRGNRRYPATIAFHDIPSYANSIQVPVLMFAGESDNYHNCCMIETAHTIATAATAAGKQFELITYPKTDHDFVDGGSHYSPKSYQDALARTGAKLKEALGN